MAKSILSITSSLLLLCLLLAGESAAATTTIRGGSSANLADVSGSALAGTEKGLVIRCASGCGGGTQYAEDSSHVSGDSLTMAGVVQQSADAALAGDGDRTALQVDANGYLKVNIKAGAGSGGTAMTDDAAFTPATTSGTPAFFMFDDVAPDSVNEGDGGIGRMSANRNQYVTIRDAAGNERGLNIDASGNLTANITGTVTVGSHAVTNAGTFATQPTSVVPGTGATNLGKAEDSAHTSADTGVLLLGVRNDSAVSGLSDTNGDYTPIATDSNGRIFISTLSAISSSMTPGTAAANLGKAEDAAHASGDTGVAVWAKRTDTPAASGADGDYVTLNSDAAGYLYAMPRSSGSTGAAPPDRASYSAGLGSGATGGFLTGIPVADSFANINVSTATTTLLVTGVSGRHVRISSLSLVTAAANNVALISGTGATCGTGTTGMNGGTTAASGWNFAANGGITQGNGLGTINQTNATGDSVCIVTSAATQLSGRLAYAIY